MSNLNPPWGTSSDLAKLSPNEPPFETGCTDCAEKDAEIERLLSAIKREASRHINTLPVECGASLMCECEICWIAREGK